MGIHKTTLDRLYNYCVYSLQANGVVILADAWTQFSKEDLKILKYSKDNMEDALHRKIKRDFPDAFPVPREWFRDFVDKTERDETDKFIEALFRSPKNYTPRRGKATFGYVLRRELTEEIYRYIIGRKAAIMKGIQGRIEFDEGQWKQIKGPKLGS